MKTKIPKYLLLVAGLFLLFFGKPTVSLTRSGAALWDLGHIIIWALGTHLLLVDLRLFYKKSIAAQFILIALIAFSIGVLSEAMQLFNGRSADIYDLLKDTVGTAIGLFFYNDRKTKLPIPLIKAVQCIILVIVIIQSLPFMKAVADETIAHIQFPVLSNFETPFEADRWVTKGRESIVTDPVFERKKALKAELRPEKYAGFTLDYFNGDWHDYHFLQFSIHNPEPDTLILNIRIDDKLHYQSGFVYSDRYNNSYPLSPGWNTIKITLEDIKKAPKTRDMDIRNIKNIMLFFIQPPGWITVYIDDVKLVKH